MFNYWIFTLFIREITLLCVPEMSSNVICEVSSLDIDDLLHGEGRWWKGVKE